MASWYGLDGPVPALPCTGSGEVIGVRVARRQGHTTNGRETYLSSVAQLVDFAEDRGLDPLARDTITEYLADLADRRKPATVAFRYRPLQQFFNWLEAQEEVEHSPMAKLRPPRLAGWRSRQMLSRYGASAADSRARERYQSMAPGDTL